MCSSISFENRMRGVAVAPLAAGLLTALAAPVQALEFQSGELTGSLVSTISYGISQRVEGRDSRLVSPGNGGTGKSNTTDDGNLNFDKGDTFSNIIKGVHDLGLQYRNLGAFARVKWWHDFELASGSRPHGHEPNSAAVGAELDDSDFHDLAQFSGIELLDAFVYGEFEVGERPLDLRLGRQVVNWGESTFIQGGINAINPVDVSAFRRPGAEIKEGLMPVNLLYASLGASDSLSVEAFYQLQWEKTVVDGCGTYFSDADFVAEGCDRVAFLSTAPDWANYIPGIANGNNGYVNRGEDREASDSGQYGLALRYYATELDTEFGAYFMNYHSRSPYISGIKGATNYGYLVSGDPSIRYFIDYPEDIKLFGLSFATNVGATAVSGEISHRRDLPVQINGNEVLITALWNDVPYTAETAAYYAAMANSTFKEKWDAAETNSMVTGWDPYNVTQAQITLVRFFDQVMGASQLALVGEVGATYVHNLPSLSEQRYGRSPVFGQGSIGFLDPSTRPDDGYVTDFAWGYRLLAKLDYKNVFGGVSVSPQLSWKHDVKGTSPTPEFQESRKALGLGVNFSYKDTYNLGLSYTNYLDSGDFDANRDHDFVALSASVTF